MRLSCYSPRNQTLGFDLCSEQKVETPKYILLAVGSHKHATAVVTRTSPSDRGEVEHTLKLGLEPPGGKSATAAT